MKRALLLLMLAAAVPAQAQVKTPAAINGCQYYTGLSLSNYQVAPLSCDSTGALRISGTISATSAVNATATLPTLSPGPVAPQGSLAGATYVQPVFSSASGGGTQVDGTHGLPVNIVGGGTSSLSVGPTGSAVPGSADYAGMNVSGTLTGLVGTANGLKVDGSAVTQPVSASALPLPSGASTAANQATIISTLGSPFQAGGSIGNTTFASTQSGTWNINNISGSITLPTGAATSALQTTGNGTLTTINTTLGSPFQAGGSIGNTTFAATQSGSWTVAATESGTWNITNITGTVSLPTGAATAAGLTTINTTLGTPMQNSGGSVTANAGTNLNTSALALESGGNLATIAGAVTSSVVQSNTKQVNGVTTLAGAGATGTGSQRVTVAQDATTIAGANPGRTYNTIAASQSAQALTGGGGGGTGDYLGFCVVIPTSTSPGVVTILDNSTTVYAFPGGTSSLSNLVPFTIPVGAASISGAWKVTTGASLSVVCTGKFT